MTACRPRISRDAKYAGAVSFGYFSLPPKKSNVNDEIHSMIQTAVANSREWLRLTEIFVTA